jgi:hypothetical protein
MTLKKKLAAVLAAAGLAVGLSLAGTGTARATDFPTPGQCRAPACSGVAPFCPACEQ